MTTADRESPPHRIAELQTDLERLHGELTRRERDAGSLQREKSRLQRKNSRLQRENDRLKQQVECLKQQLGEARRTGRRQAAPFAKDRPQGRGRCPGRKPGAKYGRHGCRPRPAEVDETHAAPVPVACPDCGGAVEVTRVASQYQEELPVVRPVVRRFDIEVGHCAQCQRRVQGRHVLQTSDALGAAGVQLGPGVVALVVELHTELGGAAGEGGAPAADHVRPAGHAGRPRPRAAPSGPRRRAGITKHESRASATSSTTFPSACKNREP